MTEANRRSPSTSQTRAVVNPSSTPPASSPRAVPKASHAEAALVTSLPENAPNSPRRLCMSSATASRTGTKAESMRVKAAETAVLKPRNTA